MRLFTIGHSNLPTEELIQRLRDNGIGVVVDVRSKPFSRYNPQYNRYVIAEDLRKAGIPYVWMGHCLGGVPENPELLTRGRPDHDKIRASQAYQDGLEELLRGAELNVELGAVALMCGEADPTGCHRRRLVGADLVERGVELLHVLKDGSVATEHEVREPLGENQISAIDMFGEA
jgi:uncharacterized protein (DUF488 family)